MGSFNPRYREPHLIRAAVYQTKGMLRELLEAVDKQDFIQQVAQSDGGHLRIRNEVQVPFGAPFRIEIDVRVTDEYGGGKTLEDRQALQITELRSTLEAIRDNYAEVACERTTFRQALEAVINTCQCQGSGWYSTVEDIGGGDTEVRKWPCADLNCKRAREALAK